MKRLLAPQYLESVATTRVTIGEGVQTPALVNMFFNGTGATPYMLSTMDFQEMQRVLGHQDAMTGAETTRRFVLDRATAAIHMKNMTDVLTYVTVYDLICRRDEKVADRVDPTYRWHEGLEAMMFSGDKGSNNPYPNSYVGATPFQSQSFVQFWLVKKSTKVVLTAGTEHTHYVTIRPRNIFTRQFCETGNLHGLTYVCMVVAHGDLTNERVTTTGNAAKICYSSGALDVLTKTRYRLQEVEKNRSSYKRYDMQQTARGLMANGTATMLMETASEAPIDTA